MAYKNPNEVAEQMIQNDGSLSDYDLFKSIYYPSWEKGRDNYLEGEQETMWKELQKYFDLPDYQDNTYGFLDDFGHKKAYYYKLGIPDGKGFGGYSQKPGPSIPLVRRK